MKTGRNKSVRRRSAEHSGRAGERQAAIWLQLHGWKILDRRRKTPLGEIDLIGRKAGVIAFFEVKWRNSVEQLDFAIDEYRLQRVAAAVEVVAHEYCKDTEDIRIDVILLAPRTIPRHIINAWQP